MHPNTDNYFASQSHDRILRLLRDSVRQREPYVVVSGEYGMGKTLLCMKFCEILKEENSQKFITPISPTATYGAILTGLVSCIGLKDLLKKFKTVPSLEAAMLNYYTSGRIKEFVYIIVDDLHELSNQMLEKLKHLANFHVNGFYPFGLVCFSHTEFFEKLEAHEKFKPFVQRFRRRLQLEPLADDELKEYIYFNLLQAKAKGRPLFSEESIGVIARQSGNIPRIINNLCDQLLLEACENQTDYISGEMAERLCGSSDNAATVQAIEEKPEVVAANPEPRAEPVIPVKSVPASQQPAERQTLNLKELAEDNRRDEDQQNGNGGGKRGTNSSRLAWFLGGTVLVLVLVLFFLVFYLFTINPGQTAGTVMEKDSESVTIGEQPTDNNLQTIPESETLSEITRPEPPAPMVKEQPANGVSKPFSLEIFTSSVRDVAEAELLRLSRLGVGPIFIGQRGEVQDLVDWSIFLGSFETLEEALTSPWQSRFPYAEPVRLLYTLQVAQGEKLVDVGNKKDEYQKMGYSSWIDQTVTGEYRLLLSAYETEGNALAQQRYLQRDNIDSTIIMK